LPIIIVEARVWRSRGVPDQGGEQALKSSASNEALLFYRKRSAFTEAARDRLSEKVAMLEKNIGWLFLTGALRRGCGAFRQGPELLLGGLPKNALSGIKFLSSFITFILALYFHTSGSRNSLHSGIPKP